MRFVRCSFVFHATLLCAEIHSSFLDNKKRLLVSSLSGGACIHGVIKVTYMAWHASIAVGEGVRSAAQRSIHLALFRRGDLEGKPQAVERTETRVRNKSDKMIGMANKRPVSKNQRLKFSFLFKMSLYYYSGAAMRPSNLVFILSCDNKWVMVYSLRLFCPRHWIALL